MKTMIKKQLTAVMLLALASSVQAESTLVLDLEEQFSQQVTALQQMEQRGSHRISTSSEVKQLQAEAQRLPPGSVDRKHAVAEYVAVRTDELGQKYEAVNELRALNSEVVDTLDRLIAARHIAESKSNKSSVVTDRHVSKMAKVAIASNTRLLQLLERDQLFQSKSQKYLQGLTRAAMKKLGGNGKANQARNRHKMERLEELLDVLVAQDAILDQAANSLGNRLGYLRDVNDGNRFAGIIDQTDEVLENLGILDMLLDEEGEELDYAIGDLVFGEESTGSDNDYGTGSWAEIHQEAKQLVEQH
ncbi:MAG: hypothetical protein AB2809_13300 [Candidatus Thiodiazotropha sp.]